jgi:hypothetical protein
LIGHAAPAEWSELQTSAGLAVLECADVSTVHSSIRSYGHPTANDQQMPNVSAHDPETYCHNATQRAADLLNRCSISLVAHFDAFARDRGGW